MCVYIYIWPDTHIYTWQNSVVLPLTGKPRPLWGLWGVGKSTAGAQLSGFEFLFYSLLPIGLNKQLNLLASVFHL